MKIINIVNYLRERIPNYTNLFHSQQLISSLSSINGLATMTLAIENTTLETGDKVLISGSLVNNPITSLTQIDGIATAVCQNDHDLTENYQDEITISGATESKYNGTFLLLSVPTGKSFTFSIDETAPASATGSPVLKEDVAINFNGYHEVTKIDTTHFTFAIDNLSNLTSTGTMILNYNFRIHGTGDEQKVLDSYTKQINNNYYIFVMTGETTTNKDRNINLDSNYIFVDGQDFEQTLFQKLFISIIAPCKNELMARQIKDIMEDMRPILFHSLLGLKPSSGFIEDEVYGITFYSDNIKNYKDAYYEHEFIFEQVAVISYEDIAIKEKSVALRYIDIEYLKTNGDELKKDTINIPN